MPRAETVLRLVAGCTQPALQELRDHAPRLLLAMAASEALRLIRTLVRQHAQERGHCPVGLSEGAYRKALDLGHGGEHALDRANRAPRSAVVLRICVLRSLSVLPWYRIVCTSNLRAGWPTAALHSINPHLPLTSSLSFSHTARLHCRHIFPFSLSPDQSHTFSVLPHFSACFLPD